MKKYGAAFAALAACLSITTVLFIIHTGKAADTLPADPRSAETDPASAPASSESMSETTTVTEETTISETTAETVTSAAVTVSETQQTRAEKKYDGKSVYISAENILQYPELPVGSEITSLTILLRHFGYPAEKTELAREHLPIASGRTKFDNGRTYKESFYEYFIGDPFSAGYGCLADAIEKAAVSYISENGDHYSVYNISGCSPGLLYRYLENGFPVLVWATEKMAEPEYYETWYDIDTGEKLDWYSGEHCSVLVGFDTRKNTLTFNDPKEGIIDYPRKDFEKRFSQMHSQAVVILPNSISPLPEVPDEPETGTAKTTVTAADTETTAETAETEYDITTEETSSANSANEE